MRVPLSTVRLGGAGLVSTMAKPRGGDWLAGEMAALADSGVAVLVSALSFPEIDELDLVAEPDHCEAAGLRFVHIPISDRSVPDPGAVVPVLSDLAAQVSSGRHVVAHCRFGIGRSSLIAASVLVIAGLAPEVAWDQISRARGTTVPDTDEQRQWVADIAYWPDRPGR